MNPLESDELSNGWMRDNSETSSLSEGSLIYLFHLIQTDRMMPANTALIFTRTMGPVLRAASSMEREKWAPVGFPPPAAVSCVLTRDIALAPISSEWLREVSGRHWSGNPKAMRQTVSDWCARHQLDGIDLVGDRHQRLLINRPGLLLRVSHGTTH